MRCRTLQVRADAHAGQIDVSEVPFFALHSREDNREAHHHTRNEKWENERDGSSRRGKGDNAILAGATTPARTGMQHPSMISGRHAYTYLDTNNEQINNLLFVPLRSCFL
jgi:hypothetical protein